VRHGRYVDGGGRNTAIAKKHGHQVRCVLYGQEINPETYAVCKADMLLKGEGDRLAG